MRELSLDQYRDALGPLCLEVRGDLAGRVAGACSDSREVRPGYLFCAIPGARDDGTRYVPEALARGAAGVVVTRPVEVPPATVRILVRDAYAAAGRLAECAAGRPADRLQLIGITGTNGKTTCAYLLREILRRAGMAPGMIGTVCHDLGTETVPAQRTTPTPFDIQRLFGRMVANGCRWAILEMSSHALHQHRTGTARFRAALFTNLTGDHLDYHRTMEAYFEAKSILFRELLSSDGAAAVNVDDPYGRRL
ncbi:MAG: UDP-N-acetylmuramoyl-L-alanyl-D-glutamate--2,6-diaminopimelate ligase, partial [Lentisphaeria bacterium]|nr:UDP-N-acetylmuramoyl-L-alanyl-D-glutamate--2,6-diaminopimelate ligase [Lentisphaeria bacterium]